MDQKCHSDVSRRVFSGDADLVPSFPSQEMREFVDPEGKRYRNVREAEMEEPSEIHVGLYLTQDIMAT